MNIQGKTCLITGASSGIGREVALHLARLGATVVIVCRDKRSASKTRDEIAAQSSNNAIEDLAADLSRQHEVRRLAEEFQARYKQLHVLVNNAGANFSTCTLTEDHIESTFAINAVAPFLLTELLSGVLKASTPSRVINVASGMLSPIEFNDVVRRDRQYKQMAVYAQSKMAVVLYTKLFAESLKPSGVTAVSMTPGMVRTGLGRNTKGGLKLFLTMMSLLMRKPQDGAADVVRLATMPEAELVNGGFYKKDELVQPKGADAANVEQVAKLMQTLIRV